jgi:pSer/pThr/pTyr-binding forkhead associated (FHA) protein
MKTPPVITVQLVHLQGPLKGQIQEIAGDVITIGRQADCSVAFPKELTTISRMHTEIVREGNRFKITDKSANGTFVNGKRIMEAYLKDGDVVMFTEGGPKLSFLAAISESAVEADTAPSKASESSKPEPVVIHAEAPEPVVFKPEVVEPPAVFESPKSKPAPPTPVPPSEPVKPEPVAEAPKPQAVFTQAQPQAPSYASGNAEKVQAPLFIQFGPALRSYKELPVTLGKNPSSDFVIAHASMMDSHAQIVYIQGQYRIRDLTGKNLITINGAAAGFETVLKADDIIYLSPNGPALRFMGEGRLAEYEPEVSDEESPVAPARPAVQKEDKQTKGLKGFMDFFKK